MTPPATVRWEAGGGSPRAGRRVTVGEQAEHGYYRLMLLLTVVLAVLAVVVTVAVLLVRDDDGPDPTGPRPSPSVSRGPG